MTADMHWFALCGWSIVGTNFSECRDWDCSGSKYYFSFFFIFLFFFFIFSFIIFFLGGGGPLDIIAEVWLCQILVKPRVWKTDHCEPVLDRFINLQRVVDRAIFLETPLRSTTATIEWADSGTNLVRKTCSSILASKHYMQRKEES